MNRPIKAAAAAVSPRGATGSDYIDPPLPQKKALCLVFGETGCGKSTTGLLHVPGPVSYHDIDNRGFHACQEARAAGKVVRYLELDYPKHIGNMDEKEAMAAAKIVVDKHWKNLEWSVRESEKGNVRTITWDTGSELADLVNIMFTGRPERRNDDYGASSNMIKVEMAKMIKAVRNEGNANLVILAHAKEVWEQVGTTSSGKPKREASGKFTFRGPEVLGSQVDWAGHLRLTKTSVKAKGTDRAKKHEMEITIAKIVLATQGDVYTEDQWDEYGPFAFACAMQYPDSQPEDWTE
jgi:hypothetical protein